MEATSVDLQRQLELYKEWQKPMWHTPISLGIREFKKKLDVPGLSKGLKSKLIKAYKKRAWAEYHGTARDRGTFPTHNANSKHVKITTNNGMGNAEFEIKVKNGTTNTK